MSSTLYCVNQGCDLRAALAQQLLLRVVCISLGRVTHVHNNHTFPWSPPSAAVCLQQGCREHTECKSKIEIKMK